MQLKKLEIKLNEWGDNKDKYTAEIKLADIKGEITLILDPKTSVRLIGAASDAIKAFAYSAQAELTRVIEAACREAAVINDASEKKD